MARKKLGSVKKANLPSKAKKPTPNDTVFQFKITLLGAKPQIWRRIQVTDCTLDNLHEYVQTAMGWMNSHLHEFRIGEQRYGDPMLMEENFEEMDYKDSTTTTLSEIVPKGSKRRRLLYQYDFGDCWEHEVLFEGSLPADPSVGYPICLEGERACPPEDVGGVRGYASLLAVIKDKRHEQHDVMLEWAGGNFAPEAFDPAKATKAMRKGLPVWRKETR